MAFLRQGPSRRAASYPGYRLGGKGQRRGLRRFHDQPGPGALAGSRRPQGIHAIFSSAASIGLVYSLSGGIRSG